MKNNQKDSLPIEIRLLASMINQKVYNTTQIFV